MDIDVDEEQTVPEEWDEEFEYESNEPWEQPWQCGLSDIQERAMALFRNGNFTDLTLTFPETDITYEAHCLILAIASPVFEGLLYGPMRAEGRNVQLHGDDPSAMEFVIAYCYGFDLTIDDMDLALDVYTLADKYILDGLKNHCCKHIVSHMNKDNVKDVIEFAEKYNFTEFIKNNCVPYFKEMFEDMKEKDKDSRCYEDEPDYTVSSTILMDLNNDWLEVIIPEISINILSFFKGWEYPESPLIYNRLSIILSNKWDLINKFYGCINAENIQHFSLGHYNRLDLCLSVTDPHHAKRVIEAINQQNRFEKNLIAIHIRCGEVWPRNWLPLRIERTHRPSMLLISDAGDDNVAWVIEAAKALLPKSEGTYTKQFTRNRYDEDGDKTWDWVKTVNILKLPRSRFTLNGVLTLLQGLVSSGVRFHKILLQSPHISSTQLDILHQFNQVLQCLSMDHNFFRKVFEEFPIIEY